MSIEDIVRAWKTNEEALDLHLPASPVGRELDERELLEVFGGDCTDDTACVRNSVTTGGHTTKVEDCGPVTY